MVDNISTNNSNNVRNQSNGNYYIETYGCQMNVYDSELVENQLKQSGYKATKKIESADLIFLNTCAIREKAEETVHNRLNSIEYLKKKNPNLLIGVLGCMAQNLKNDLLIDKPYVDIILGPDSYRKIPEIIQHRNTSLNNIVDTKLSKFEVYNDLFPSRKEGINAWVSIMRGCDKFCTFCIVPFTRGRERSRPINVIKAEIVKAVKQGFVEITLLGQNVNSYYTPEGDFNYLLNEISIIDGVKRIRYTSPHPQDFNDEILKTMSLNKNICNYIHLPLQSGSNRILKSMNRTYTREKFLNLVDKIYTYMPNCSISTDIIVGFPGETASDFEDTLDIVEKTKFNFSYMFKYSPRPGTKAVEFDNQIPEDVKQSRLEDLIAFQNKITLDVNTKKIGTIENVLIEKESKKSKNYWAGRTEGNIWTIIKKGNEFIKDIVPVQITNAQGVTLFGNNLNVKDDVHEIN